MKLVLVDIEEAPLRDAETALKQAGVETLALRVDVGDGAGMAAAATRALDTFGLVHLIVSNAGVGGGAGPMWQLSEADWRWALDVNLTHYRYPSTTVDLNWTEAIGTLTWKQNYWAQLAYSTEALATDETGAYAQLGAKVPLSDQLRLEAAAGYYWLDDAYDDSYAHAQLGAVWAFKAPFELRVTAHATDSSAKTLFPALAGSRVEAALQASF